MCKPKPGPRCTPHMRTRLEQATARVATARARLAEHPTHTRLQRRLAAAEADYAQTLALYDSTPGGQDDLRAAIEATTDPHDRHALTVRLRDAERLRAEQVDALRRARTEHTDEEGTDDAPRGTDDAGAARSVLEDVRLESGPSGSRTDRDRGSVDRSEDRGGRSPRLLINGRQITPVATHTLPGDVRAKLESRGLSAPPLHELAPDDCGLYREQMLELTRKNPHAASVYVYDEGEYRDMRLLVTDDGKAGVALKGDEVVSVFAHKDCAHPRAARAMLRHATALGGHRLDCFDTVLPDLYADAGFVPVARLRWNDDYAPDGWDYDTFRAFNDGRPDVVFMAYDPDRVDGKYTPGVGEYVEDYDDGIARAQQYRPH